MRKYVSSGCDLHTLSQETGRTPLLEVFRGSMDYSRRVPRKGIAMTKIILEDFLDDLRASGIDLLEYGKKEKELHNLGIVKQDIEYRCFDRPGIVTPKWRLTGFTYGPSIQDWQFWGSEPSDEFVGDFWYQIEHPWDFIAGAWTR